MSYNESPVREIVLGTIGTVVPLWSLGLNASGLIVAAVFACITAAAAIESNDPTPSGQDRTDLLTLGHVAANAVIFMAYEGWVLPGF